jgi:hypothetical protein
MWWTERLSMALIVAMSTHAYERARQAAGDDATEIDVYTVPVRATPGFAQRPTPAILRLSSTPHNSTTMPAIDKVLAYIDSLGSDEKFEYQK